MKHDWKVGDTVYKARTLDDSVKGLHVDKARVLKVFRNGKLKVDDNRFAWGCHVVIDADIVYPTEASALLAFAFEKTTQAAKLRVQADVADAVAKRCKEKVDEVYKSIVDKMEDSP